MGHSLISEILREDDPANDLSRIELLKNFFNPHPSYEKLGTDSILKYLADHACPAIDRYGQAKTLPCTNINRQMYSENTKLNIMLEIALPFSYYT